MTTAEININDLKILTRSWIIPNAKANIILVHGYGEHSGRYQETAERLNTIGCNVYSYDRRGEGKSEGNHADIKDIDNHVADLIQFKKQLNLDSIPIYIMAHSLGGLVSVKYIIDHKPEDIAGIVLSSPLLKIDDGTAPLLQKVAGFVAKILPKLPTVKLDSTLISRDKLEVDKYNTDPLIFHGSTNARTGYAIIKAIKYIQANYSKFSMPCLLLHGSEDKLADPKGSQWMYDGMNSEDKKLVILEGLYHEMMREPEKEDFFQHITLWLSERMK